MGCARSVPVSPSPAVHVDDAKPTLRGDATAGDASASAPDADARSQAPMAMDRVVEAMTSAEYVTDTASTIVSNASSILEAAPPGIADSLASGVATGAVAAASAAMQFTAENAPAIATFLGQLCGSAADLLSAIAPAIPFGGVAAAALGLVAEQGAAYAQAFQAAHALRQTIADRRSTIEEFAGSAGLAAKHASLVGHAAQALRDAVGLLTASYSGPKKLRSEVFKFFTAKGGLQALQEATAAIQGLADAIGAAAAVSAAVGIAQIATTQARLLSLQESDIARRDAKEMRPAVTAHLAMRAARTGRGLLPVYGLTLEELSGAPPAAVTLWVDNSIAEGTVTGATGCKTMQTTGAEAMKELLAPRTAPGVAVVVGAAGMGKTLLLNTVAACHAAASLSADELTRVDVSHSPAKNSGLIKGAALRDAYERVVTVRLRDFARLDGDDSPFTKQDMTVLDAVAWAVAELFDLQAKLPMATPQELGVELLGSTDAPAPRTLWLLDGFDEAPGAESLATVLAEPVKAAFTGARDRKLAAPCNALTEVTFRNQPASSIPVGARLQAVLRVLLTQPNVVVSSRPQFEALLAPFTGLANSRFLRLDALAPHAVQAFVREALKADVRGLRNVEERMAGAPGLREQMRTPVLMLIAIATYRHGGDDGADEIVDVSVPPSGGAITGSGCLDSLPVAPGGPNKFQLDDIDIRAPIAGLYVRLERLLAKQVWDAHTKACQSSGAHLAASERFKQWQRLRVVLAQAALAACSTPGATRVAWPAGTSTADSELLLGARVVAADSSGGFEFPHRSIQEYFGAVAILMKLAKEPDQTDSVVVIEPLKRLQSANDIWGEWNDSRVPGIPRGVVLAVLLSDTAFEGQKPWALAMTDWSEDSLRKQMYELNNIPAGISPTAAGCPSPLKVVSRALSDPANDVLRHLTVALLYRPAPNTCDHIISAIAAGCEASVFCDYLGDCLPLFPAGCAAKLAVRRLFDEAVSVFWGMKNTTSISTVHMLGHNFWCAADAMLSGALIDRAFATIRAALPPNCPDTSMDGSVALACAAVAIVGSVSHLSSREALTEAHDAIALASASSVEVLASEATFARVVLAPLPGSKAATEGLRERLLKLARSSTMHGSATLTANRAVAELARRYGGDSVVHAVLKTDAMRGFMTPFVNACVEGPGISLISFEIACTLFQWLDPVDCTRLAVRLWDALADSSDVLSAGFTPLHVAAARSRCDFIAVYCGQEDVDVAAAINAESAGGCTPLNVCGTKTEENRGAVVDCALALVAAGARWGRPCISSRSALHAASAMGSADIVGSLLAAPGATPDVINARDERGLTPLHMAVDGDRFDVVALLLATQGVDPTLTNEHRMTPLDYALEYGHAAAAALLRTDPRVAASRAAKEATLEKTTKGHRRA